MTLAIYCLILSSYYAPALCGWVYSVKQQFCYQIVLDQPKTWQEAREYCQQNGGDLLKITNDTEQNFIQAVLSKGTFRFYWIGATDQSSKGSWYWTDNTTVVYSKWSVGEPNNIPDEDCAEMATAWNYQWNNKNCLYKEDFICRKNCKCFFKVLPRVPLVTDFLSV